MKRRLDLILRSQTGLGAVIVMAFVVGCGAGVLVAICVLRQAHGASWGMPTAGVGAFSIAATIIYCVVAPFHRRAREVGKA